MKKYVFILATLLLPLTSNALANFTCTVSAIPQHADYKQHYTVHGEQNPLLVTYDYAGPKEQVHYYQIDTYGKLVYGLTEAGDESNYFVRLKFNRVVPPPELELPSGVRIQLHSGKLDTYAGLGMRDNYDTYVQDVTGELPDGRKVLIVLACTR